MDLAQVPDKPYYRIGEVAAMLGIETHVLRYWESEFPQLKPVRAASRHRLYKKQDLGILFYIKRLLHDEGYTIAGAKRKLLESPDPSPESACSSPATPVAGDEPPTRAPEPGAPMAEVLSELKALMRILDK